MPQHYRTARPPGDIRAFEWTVDISAGVTEGLLYLIEATVAIAFQTIAFGLPVAMTYHIEKVMVNKAAVAMTVGQKVYWSGVNGAAVTNVYDSNFYWIGIVVADAAAGDAQVKIDLKGDKATLTEPL